MSVWFYIVLFIISSIVFVGLMFICYSAKKRWVRSLIHVLMLILILAMIITGWIINYKFWEGIFTGK